MQMQRSELQLDLVQKVSFIETKFWAKSEGKLHSHVKKVKCFSGSFGRTLNFEFCSALYIIIVCAVYNYIYSTISY